MTPFQFQGQRVSASCSRHVCPLPEEVNLTCWKGKWLLLSLYTKCAEEELMWCAWKPYCCQELSAEDCIICVEFEKVIIIRSYFSYTLYMCVYIYLYVRKHKYIFLQTYISMCMHIHIYRHVYVHPCSTMECSQLPAWTTNWSLLEAFPGSPTNSGLSLATAVHLRGSVICCHRCITSHSGGAPASPDM